MKKILSVTMLLSGIMAVIASCSGEAVKRTTYETLQNMREQECNKNPSVDCEQRESMEVYEDKRTKF